MDSECKLYSKNLISKLQLIYIIAIILWIFLIVFLKLLQVDPIGWFFLIIPLIVYSINLTNIDQCNMETDKELFKANFLSLVFLTAIILINWDKDGDKRHVFKLLFISIILLALSFIDFWVCPELQILNKHIKSILQTASISLLIYTLYIYYQQNICRVNGVNRMNEMNGNKNSF